VAYTAAKSLGISTGYQHKEGVTGKPNVLDWTTGIDGIAQFRKDLEARQDGNWTYGSDWNP
jgi:hypothetical protein